MKSIKCMNLECVFRSSKGHCRHELKRIGHGSERVSKKDYCRYYRVIMPPDPKAEDKDKRVLYRDSHSVKFKKW